MTYLVATPERTDTEELIRVLVWRFKQLCRSGFELELATTIAARVDVDLHRAIDLVEHGCPPELAGRIVL
jgi:hypothetical protein